MAVTIVLLPQHHRRLPSANTLARARRRLPRLEEEEDEEDFSTAWRLNDAGAIPLMKGELLPPL